MYQSYQQISYKIAIKFYTQKQMKKLTKLNAIKEKKIGNNSLFLKTNIKSNLSSLAPYKQTKQSLIPKGSNQQSKKKYPKQRLTEPKRKVFNNNQNNNCTATKKQGELPVGTVVNDHQLQSQFDLAIHHVFDTMDLFSRGTVTEANISNQVPEKALYFLGQAFQMIRLSRKPVSKQHFQKQCLKLFRKSSQGDIKEFVKEMQQQQKKKNEKPFTFEYDEDQPRKTIESRVEDRVVISKNHDHQQSFISFNMESKQLKNNNLNSKDDRKLLLEKGCLKKNIKGVRWKNQKKNLPSPLLQINNFENVCPSTYLYYPTRKDHQPIEKYDNLQQKKTNLDQLERNNLSPCFRMKDFYQQETNNPSYGLKTIKVIQNKPSFEQVYHNVNQSLRYRQNIQNRENQNHEREPMATLEHSNSGNKSITLRNDDKLDKLTNRLESYIKQNALRLQKSKNVRLQIGLS